MSEDLSEMFSKVKDMVDRGDIPDNLKEALGSLNNQGSSDKSTSSDGLSDLLNNLNTNNNSQKSDSSGNIDLSSLSSLLGGSNNDNSDGSDFKIDINTILKMKSIIEAMNKKDDPRANLLYSLKPYLRESRKSKLDQYVNLLNMTKIADFMKNDKKENDGNA